MARRGKKKKRGRSKKKAASRESSPTSRGSPSKRTGEVGGEEAAETAAGRGPADRGRDEPAVEVFDLDEVPEQAEALAASDADHVEDSEPGVGDRAGDPDEDDPGAADGGPASSDADRGVATAAVTASDPGEQPRPDGGLAAGASTDSAPTARDGDAVDREPGGEAGAEHAGEGAALGPSTPEDRARLLAEALAHAEMQEARYRVPAETRRAGRIKGTLALLIFSIAALLVLLPPSFVVPAPTGELRDSDRRRGVVLSLLLQAEQIEAFRAREQALPRSLADVEVRLPGVRYVRSSNRLFQLIAYTEDGVAVVYDSSAPSPEFESAAPAWRPGP